MVFMSITPPDEPRDSQVLAGACLRQNRESQRRRSAVRWTGWCTPGMGVNLWGESPLYVNPVNVFNTLTKVLADGKGVSVRKGLKEA